MKKLRNINMLQSYRDTPCLVCESLPSDPHHIKSRGAGGKDDDWNLLPLCREHHTEWHTKGWYSFVCTYPPVVEMLDSKGWDMNTITKKLFNPRNK